MLLFASSVKLVVEIALLSLLAQGIVGLFAGAGRHTNFIYRLFKVLTDPFARAVRRLAPSAVPDRHVPLVTVLLLAMVWIIVTVFKIRLCLDAGVQTCR